MLGRLRRATRALLWMERASDAMWPSLGILGGFICLALLGLPQTLPFVLHVILLAVILAVLGWSLWRARFGFGWPNEAVADRRLERVAGLPHRPLAVLSDRPSGPSELWGWHQARALAQVGRLRLGWPQPIFPTRDPRALRLLLLLGLTIGWVMAGPDASDRLIQAMLPRGPSLPAPPALEVRAWMTPPAFTFLPPVLLPDGGAVEAPAGSRLTIGVSGGSDALPSLLLGDKTLAFEPIGGNSFEIKAEPQADGVLVVRRDGAAVARWDLTLRPDLAPAMVFVHPPVALRGRLPQVRLAWKATHEYGVVALGAEIRLRDRPAAAPLAVAIPLGGHPREAAGTTTTDLTASPWAGLPVLVTLVGRDGAGLTGRSEAAAFVLPARRFRHPGAQAIIAIRQMLALAPQDGAGAAVALRQAAGRALWPDGDPAPDMLRAIAATLEGKPDDRTIDAAQAQLWALALRLEEGTVQRTADALRKAQKDLRASLTPSDPKSALDKTEIERRAQSLAEAMRRQQQALADQAKRNPGSASPISPQDAEAARQKLEQLRDAARGDRPDEARERMAELDQMLDAMRKAGRSTAQRERDAGREKGHRQMSVLQDLVRRQASQIDRAESRLATPGPADQRADRDHDRAVQSALRRVLGELMQQHGDLTGSVPKNLGEADAAMRAAGAALADGRDDLASAAALRAVEALQQGGQQMSQQLAQQFGPPQPGDAGQQGDPDQGADGDGQQANEDGGNAGDSGDGAGDDGSADMPGDGQAEGGDTGPDGRKMGRNRDPLGRPTHDGLMGSDGGRDTHVPEEMEQARGRAVQEELRRREAQRARPQQELDYIGRLLKRD